jgi:ribosomal protein S27AE
VVSDDVRVGQTVAIVGHRCRDDNCDMQCTGHPFRVVAVSLPFAILEDCAGKTRHPIDLREWELGRVDAKYVRALVGGQRAEPEPAEAADDGHRRCVRCGDRLAQRLVGRGCWRWSCERCGMVGEAVEK